MIEFDRLLYNKEKESLLDTANMKYEIWNQEID